MMELPLAQKEAQLSRNIIGDIVAELRIGAALRGIRGLTG
jgi:hypothetical protein